MFAGLIVMAILGCSDDGEDCRKLATATTTYASVAECNAASAAALQGYADLPYPVIATACEKAPQLHVAAAR